MARLKNAKRSHFIAPYKVGVEPKEEEFLKIAKWIETISDDTDEETDDTGFYDGDGTSKTTVISVKGSYTFEGYYDVDDKAQEMIANMKYKTGDDKEVWHKIISSDGKKEWLGNATVSEIKAGEGDATEFETFGCKITFNEIPKETLKPGTKSTKP